MSPNPGWQAGVPSGQLAGGIINQTCGSFLTRVYEAASTDHYSDLFRFSDGRAVGQAETKPDADATTGSGTFPCLHADANDSRFNKAVAEPIAER